MAGSVMKVGVAAGNVATDSSTAGDIHSDGRQLKGGKDVYVGQGRVGGGIGRHSGCLEHGRAEDAVAGSVGKGALVGEAA